jgi:hypothetical protein
MKKALTVSVAREFLEDPYEMAFEALVDFTSIDDQAARIMARYEHDSGDPDDCGISIDLSGLRSLTDYSAKYLRKLDGDLNLSGVSKLSDVAIKHLSRHRGSLSLGIRRISDESARSLGAIMPCGNIIHPGDSEPLARLELDRLTKLSDAAAAHLASHGSTWEFFIGIVENVIDRPGETKAKDEWQRAFVDLLREYNYEGETLSLNRVTQISDSAALALSKHYGPVSMARMNFEEFPDSPGYKALQKKLKGKVGVKNRLRLLFGPIDK